MIRWPQGSAGSGLEAMTGGASISGCTSGMAEYEASAERVTVNGASLRTGSSLATGLATADGGSTDEAGVSTMQNVTPQRTGIVNNERQLAT